MNVYIQWVWQWDEWKMKWVWNWLLGVWKLGHLVWNTMLRVRNTCAWYEMKAQHETKKDFTRYEIFVWKKFLGYENKNLKVRVWNCFWGYEKYLGKVWNFCIRVWKKFWRYEKSFEGMKMLFRVWNYFWGYEIIFEGMKKYLLGMKKIQFLQKNIFIP